jgi:hypothetical protein
MGAVLFNCGNGQDDNCFVFVRHLCDLKTRLIRQEMPGVLVRCHEDLHYSEELTPVWMDQTGVVHITRLRSNLSDAGARQRFPDAESGQSRHNQAGEPGVNDIGHLQKEREVREPIE